MRYLVVDPDGQLRQRTAPRYDVALREVGPEGWARVPMHAAAGPENVHVAGFVNDCGFLFPDRYLRNVVGTCLLVSVGGNVQPYAGPVVLTGWDPEPYSADPEVRSLSEDQVAALRRTHRDIRIVLGLDTGEPSGHAVPHWRAAITKVAALAQDAPEPAIRVLTDDEALAWLGRWSR